MKPSNTGKSINILDSDYLQWIQDLCNRYRQSQIKASLQINRGILTFYWELGKDIEERKYDNKYGSHFYENLSRDLSGVLNNKKGLAPTSLRYTKYFYCHMPHCLKIVGNLPMILICCFQYLGVITRKSLTR